VIAATVSSTEKQTVVPRYNLTSSYVLDSWTVFLFFYIFYCEIRLEIMNIN